MHHAQHHFSRCPGEAGLKRRSAGPADLSACRSFRSTHQNGIASSAAAQIAEKVRGALSPAQSLQQSALRSGHARSYSARPGVASGQRRAGSSRHGNGAEHSDLKARSSLVHNASQASRCEASETVPDQTAMCKGRHFAVLSQGQSFNRTANSTVHRFV